MAEYLIIHIDKTALNATANPDMEVDWCIADTLNKSTTHINRDRLSTLQAEQQNRQVIVLLPTIAVLLTQVEVPAKSFSQVQKAVPYILEEQMTSHIDELHFVIAKPDKRHDQQYPIAVIEVALMDRLLALFNQADIQLDVLMPDCLTLPFENHNWTIAIEGDQAIVRNGYADGFSIEKQNLAPELDLYLAELSHGQPEKLIIYNYNEDNYNLTLKYNHQDIAIEHIKQGRSLLHDMAQNLLSEGPIINLLQGKYRVKQRLNKSNRIWLANAGLFAAIIFIAFLIHSIAYFYLRYQNHKLDAEINKLYYQVFPNANNVIDPRLRIERKLKQLDQWQNDHGFLNLMAKAAPILNQNQDKVEIVKLSFDGQRLQVQVKADSYQALTNLTKQLKVNGLTANQSEAVSKQKHVLALITITEVNS